MKTALLFLVMLSAAAATPLDEFAALRSKHATEEYQVALAALKALALTPVPVPAVPADPKDSERREAEAAQSVNSKLASIAGVVRQATANPPELEPGFVVMFAADLAADRKFLAMYNKLREPTTQERKAPHPPTGSIKSDTHPAR